MSLKSSKNSITLLSLFFFIFWNSFNGIAQLDYKSFHKIRKSFTKHLLAGEYEKIDFTKQIQSHYYILSEFEQELFCLLNKNYFGFLEFYFQPLKHFQTAKQKNEQYELANNRDDAFHKNLVLLVLENKEDILETLANSRHENHAKDFIRFYLDRLEIQNKEERTFELQVSLIKRALEFTEKYPLSPYTPEMRKATMFYEPGAFAFDFNTGISSGFYTNNLSNHLSGFWGFDLDFRFFLHSTFFGFKGHVTFNKSKEAFLFNDNYVIADRRGIAMTFVDLYMGRKFYLNNRFSVLPYFSYSVTEFSIFGGGEPMDETNWNWVYTWNPAYCLDIQYDIVGPQQFQRTIFAKHSRKLHYPNAHLRLSVSVHDPNLALFNPDLKGRKVDILFGIGAHLRHVKRIDAKKYRDASLFN